MRRRLTALIALFLLVGLCTAAVPPRTVEQLRREATDIVVGGVRFVYAGQQRVAHGTDTRYCIELAVTRVEKGSVATSPATRPATRILYAHGWRPAQRPDGWAGPQGQNVIPEPGQRVRLYLTRDPEGRFDLLEPNGVEPVKE